MSYKRIISFGDSFTFGVELNDCVSEEYLDILKNPERYPEQYKLLQERNIMAFGLASFDNTLKNFKSAYSYSTWPALLAKDLGAEYVCHAWGGHGNQAINRNVVRFIDNYNQDDLVIINWTHKARWDAFDNSEAYPRDYWKTVSPGTADTYPELTKFYLNHLQSPVWDNWTTLHEILLASTLLKSRNIDFIMTCVEQFDNDITPPVHYIDVVKNLVADDITWFDGLGFVDWSDKHNYPKGPGGHPLEQAHTKAFEYIKENVFNK